MAKQPSSSLTQDPADEGYDDDLDMLDSDLSDTDDWADDSAVEDAPPKKKKGGLFNVIVIGLGAVLFLGLMYAQMSNVPQNTQTAPQAETVPDTATAAPPADVPQPTGTPNGTDATAGPGPLTPMPEFTEAIPVDPVQNVPTEGVQATPAPADVATAPVPAPTAVNQIVPPVVTLTPNEPAPVPAVSMTQTAPEMPAPVEANTSAPTSDAAVPAVAPAPAPVVAASSAADTAKMAALEKQVTELTAAVDAATAAREKAAAQDAETIKTLKDQVQSLNARLRAGDHPSASSPEESSPVEAVTPARDSPVAAAEPASKRVRYVLRAVSNGTAYIGRANGASSSLVPVQIGDAVDGFGTVKDIRQSSSGRWQVVTTVGVIGSK